MYVCACVCARVHVCACEEERASRAIERATGRGRQIGRQREGGREGGRERACKYMRVTQKSMCVHVRIRVRVCVKDRELWGGGDAPIRPISCAGASSPSAFKIRPSVCRQNATNEAFKIRPSVCSQNVIKM